ncbi:hypothetical protein SNEBB_005471 [Seison nebaliae]|nr:hypothetical protein SNEBB_005471 [Seison nebaliae]
MAKKILLKLCTIQFYHISLLITSLIKSSLIIEEIIVCQWNYYIYQISSLIIEFSCLTIAVQLHNYRQNIIKNEIQLMSVGSSSTEQEGVRIHQNDDNVVVVLKVKYRKFIRFFQLFGNVILYNILILVLSILFSLHILYEVQIACVETSIRLFAEVWRIIYVSFPFILFLLSSSFSIFFVIYRHNYIQPSSTLLPHQNEYKGFEQIIIVYNSSRFVSMIFHYIIAFIHSQTNSHNEIYNYSTVFIGFQPIIIFFSLSCFSQTFCEVKKKIIKKIYRK